MRVEDGGELRTRSVTIGEDGYHLPYADGNITVTGAGSLWNTGSMFIAGSSTNDGGFGSVSVSNDATVKAHGIVTLWADADVYLSGGLLEVSLFDDRGGDVHWTGGTLRILNQLTELDAAKLLGDDVYIYSGKRLEHRRDLKFGKDGPAVMRLSGTGSARVGYGAASDKTTL